jgi:hypothetical protein
MIGKPKLVVLKPPILNSTTVGHWSCTHSHTCNIHAAAGDCADWHTPMYACWGQLSCPSLHMHPQHYDHDLVDENIKRCPAHSAMACGLARQQGHAHVCKHARPLGQCKNNNHQKVLPTCCISCIGVGRAPCWEDEKYDGHWPCYGERAHVDRSGYACRVAPRSLFYCVYM